MLARLISKQAILMKTLTKSDAIKALLKNDFRSFLGFAFRQLHGDKWLAPNWHIDLMADRMGAFGKGEPQRLVLNAPPRSLKSFSGSVALPAFLLGRDPTMQIILIVGHGPLGRELMGKLQRLMLSSRYRSLFPHIHFDRKALNVQLKAGGFIKLAYVGQQISGRGADLVIIDDPLSPSYARDKQRRNAVNDWFESDVLTRLNNKSAGSVLLIMQRIHPQDLAGHIQAHHRAFKSLVLPAIASWDMHWVLSDGREIKRSKYEVLEPARESFEQLLRRLDELGSFQFNAQYLQGIYLPFIEQEEEGMWLYEELPPNATGTEDLICGLFMISYKRCIIHRIFGIPYTGPKMTRYQPVMTEAQQDAWQEKSIWYQRLLSTDADTEAWNKYYEKHPRAPDREITDVII